MSEAARRCLGLASLFEAATKAERLCDRSAHSCMLLGFPRLSTIRLGRNRSDWRNNQFFGRNYQDSGRP